MDDMGDGSPKRRAALAALRATVPVLWGSLAIGMTFGCMLYLRTGYGWPVAMCMSLLLYAGAMQFLAVPLIAGGAPLGQIALLTFLVNARHMVYGLSLFDDFARCGRGKPYAIFGLTDEAYALHAGTKPPAGADPGAYTLWVTGLCQAYWVAGSVLGSVIASLVEFNPRGIEFTLTALFLVILHGQWRQFRTKLPFAAGAGAGVLAVVCVGGGNMLLAAVIATVCLLVVLRPGLAARLAAQDAEETAAPPEGDVQA
jgi:4-azaleucine resistance transporter AzlC